jgi:hypothetical protein
MECVVSILLVTCGLVSTLTPAPMLLDMNITELREVYRGMKEKSSSYDATVPKRVIRQLLVDTFASAERAGVASFSEPLY